MLTRIDVVQGDGSETLVLSLPILGAGPKTSLLVQKVTGLNPPDIDLFIGDYSRDGGIYQGRRVGNRNPVFTIGLNPNPALDETMSTLREKLYKAFLDPLPIADFVKINLISDVGPVKYLVGYANKFETEPFGSEMLAQVSMICPDPFIRDNTEVLLSNTPGWATVPFTYAGSAETGFSAKIVVSSTTPKITLENNGFKLIINRPSVSGDIYRINTTPGERSITVETNLPEESALGYLDPTSIWLDLHSQANTMKVYGNTTADIVASIQELRFTPTFWGI